MTHHHYLAKKISNLLLFWIYIEIYHFLKLEFVKLKFAVKLEF